ncbi:MAG: 50S ribosomal protein L16 [Alphaproteobacteria bacterium]|nr:MAG: 50S ribosomal protein L16 [Alphaproteobacteria bacterium]
MLQPRRRPYKYGWKKVSTSVATSNFLVKGEYGLKALDCGRISARQIEACRSAIRRYVKRAGKLEIRIFPHSPISSKPAEVRMGSGKGSIDRYVAMVRSGVILFDISGVSEDMAKEAFARAAAKLPIKSKFVHSRNFS